MYALCCVSGVGVYVVCVVHCVYVYMVEEKALDVCQVWQLICCAYEKGQRIKVEETD